MKKMDIKPFHEFWINCNFAMLYSTLLSKSKCDRNIVYNNNYSFCIYDNMTDRGYRFKTLNVNMFLNELEDKVFVNTEEYWWYDNPNLIEDIKGLIDRNKIVRLAVDMYYWIEDSYLYHKVHSIHHAIVIGYDEDINTMIILDAGDKGYLEHIMSYEHIIEAAANAKEYPTLVSDIGTELDEIKITYDELIMNARRICKSIDQVSSKFDQVWAISQADEYDKNVVCRIIPINLVGFAYRCRANSLLLKAKFGEVANKYIQEFEDLFICYENVKNSILLNIARGENLSILEEKKHKLYNMFQKEKDIWQEVIHKSGLRF